MEGRGYWRILASTQDPRRTRVATLKIGRCVYIAEGIRSTINLQTSHSHNPHSQQELKKSKSCQNTQEETKPKHQMSRSSFYNYNLFKPEIKLFIIKGDHPKSKPAPIEAVAMSATILLPLRERTFAASARFKLAPCG